MPSSLLTSGNPLCDFTLLIAERDLVRCRTYRFWFSSTINVFFTQS